MLLAFERLPVDVLTSCLGLGELCRDEVLAGTPLRCIK